MPLNLVVCVKQIPNPDLQFQIAPGGLDIRRETLNYKVNGADEYALEAAVRLKEKHGGRVVAITAGPKRAETVLREALAKGADEAVRVAYDVPAAFDVGRVARLLAAAIRTIRSGANVPRYAPLPAIMKASRQPIKEVASSEVSLPYTFKVRRLIPPPSKGGAELIPGKADEQAKRLAQLFREKGFARG